MAEHDFSALYAQYPKIIAAMPDSFASHQFILSTSRKGLNMVNLVPIKETRAHVQAQQQDYPNNPI